MVPTLDGTAGAASGKRRAGGVVKKLGFDRSGVVLYRTQAKIITDICFGRVVVFNNSYEETKIKINKVLR